MFKCLTLVLFHKISLNRTPSCPLRTTSPLTGYLTFWPKFPFISGYLTSASFSVCTITPMWWAEISWTLALDSSKVTRKWEKYLTTEPILLKCILLGRSDGKGNSRKAHDDLIMFWEKKSVFVAAVLLENGWLRLWLFCLNFIFGKWNWPNSCGLL